MQLRGGACRRLGVNYHLCDAVHGKDLVEHWLNVPLVLGQRSDARTYRVALGARSRQMAAHVINSLLLEDHRQSDKPITRRKLQERENMW